MKRYDVRTPDREVVPGVRTFYVLSDSGVEYALKYNSATRKWSCCCPDWFHRHSVTGGNCKHITQLKQLVARNGGLRRILRGVRMMETTKC